MYQVKRASRSEFVPVRTLSYHVRNWGEPQPQQAPLVLVHGWMDVAASFQFVVDALNHNRHIIAPDWRGFGLTRSAVPGAARGADNFWHADYLADLDFLLDHYAGSEPVDLVGHSMGGNIAMVYAGVRPERIRRLVNLEGFGLPATRPSQAPGRYAKWMDELKSLHRGELMLKHYDSLEGVIQRLVKTNPRLSQDKASWLARHWAQPDAQGHWSLLGEAAHKLTSAYLYHVEDMQAIHQRITAPVLSVEGSDDSLAQWFKDSYTLAQYHERLKVVANARVKRLADAGHMMHHDQPEALAALIEDFLA